MPNHLMRRPSTWSTSISRGHISWHRCAMWVGTEFGLRVDYMVNIIFSIAKWICAQSHRYHARIVASSTTVVRCICEKISCINSCAMDSVNWFSVMVCRHKGIKKTKLGSIIECVSIISIKYSFSPYQATIYSIRAATLAPSNFAHIASSAYDNWSNS